MLVDRRACKSVPADRCAAPTTDRLWQTCCAGKACNVNACPLETLDACTGSKSLPLMRAMKADKKEAFITSNDGVKLAYETFGSDGPVVVLLHGAQVAVRSELGTQASRAHSLFAMWLQAGRARDITTIVMSMCAPGRSKHVHRLCTLTQAHGVCPCLLSCVLTLTCCGPGPGQVLPRVRGRPALPRQLRPAGVGERPLQQRTSERLTRAGLAEAARQGYHVARLAADLHDLLQILDLWVRPHGSSPCPLPWPGRD